MAQQLQDVEGPAAGSVERVERVLVGYYVFPVRTAVDSRPPQLLREGVAQFSRPVSVAGGQVSEEGVDIGCGRDVALGVALWRSHVDELGRLALQQLPWSRRLLGRSLGARQSLLLQLQLRAAQLRLDERERTASLLLAPLTALRTSRLSLTYCAIVQSSK